MHSTNKADIIGVSETWLHADIPYSESELKGYCMYRCDRTHRRGGGCLLYIKETIWTKEVVIEGQYRTETVWVAIMNGNKEEAVLGVVYGQGSQKLYNWPTILSPPHYRNGVHHTVEIICLYCREL